MRTPPQGLAIPQVYACVCVCVYLCVFVCVCVFLVLSGKSDRRERAREREREGESSLRVLPALFLRSGHPDRLGEQLTLLPRAGGGIATGIGGDGTGACSKERI